MKISAKILVYFLYVALVPLVSVSVVLVNEASKQLLQDASAKQKAVSVDLSRRVDNYLANDANQLALIARLYSTKKFDQPQIDQSLSTLFTQNSSLQTATLQTSNGIQRTYSLESDSKVKVENSTIDLISSKALDFLVDKPYIMSVGRDDHNNPQVTVGIPILKQYDKADNELFALQSGSAGNIIGALIATYNVSDLWQSVLSVKLSDGGYAYVIDKLGNLVAHPDQKFLATHATLTDTDAVRQVLKGNSDTLQTVSEAGTDVISTPHTTMTDWAVIVQEPVSSVYAGVNSYIRMSAFIGVTAIMLTVVVSIFFGRQIIRPIQQLSLGAKRLGQGQLDQKLDIRTNDELQDLAETFNGMAEGIKRLISDLKTNNLRLKFEQIKLNNIISSVSDGVIALNSNGEILSINPPAAKLTGQDARDLEGLPLEDVFKWEHDDVPFALDLKMGGIYHYTDLVLNQAGSTAYMDVMVAVLDHQDSDVAAIVTLHDQTESRELSFMKLDFVAIAAHELRTPLTVVRGYLDLLNTHADTEMTPYNYENLQKTIVGANQLRELINKLLNIARIERGDMEIFPEKLNLSEMVAENVEQHQSVAAQRDQTLHYDSAAIEPVYVPADSASIVEVLNNLIGNAIKYTPKAGQVKVSLAVEDEMVRVTVTDNGPGVPKEQRDRLFTKFYRAERSLIAGTHGTGLGLFISKTIVELQGGRIGLEPDRGEGSTFYFTLPLYNPERDTISLRIRLPEHAVGSKNASHRKRSLPKSRPKNQERRRAMNSMKPCALRLFALGLAALLVGLFTFVSSASAATVTVKAFCNVQVTIKATVPDSIEQGKSFMMTDITVQPANTYGFNVTSSIYYMSATGTSSTNYQQNFYATNPSPTTGHNTYLSYYPNWTLNATGPVGSNVTITLNKSVTVIQGYGGSPVNCNFSKTLATVPIVAASATPSTPPPSQSTAPASPSTKPSGTPSKSPTTNVASPSPSTSTAPQTTNTNKSATNDSTAVAPSTSEKPVNKSVSVVPLTIEVRDHFGTTIKNAEVMLDSSKRLTTDNRGKVTFSNVLTGPHAILVSYKGQKITKNITLGDDAISKITTIELPATPPPWPIIIGIGVTAVVLLAAATILMLRRKRSRQPDSTDTLHGVINQAVERSPSPVLSGTIPAIPMFATKSAPPPLTPWNPIPPADTPQVASTPEVAPVISETTLPLAVQPQAAPVEPPVPNISNDEPQSIQHFAPEPQTAPEPPVNEMPQLPVADNEPPVQTPPVSH